MITILYMTFFMGVNTRYNFYINKVYPSLTAGYSTRTMDIEAGLFTLYKISQTQDISVGGEITFRKYFSLFFLKPYLGATIYSYYNYPAYLYSFNAEFIGGISFDIVEDRVWLYFGSNESGLNVRIDY